MDTTTLLWTLAATLFAGLQTFSQKVAAQEKRDSAFNGFMMYAVSGSLAVTFLIFQPPLSDVWPLIALFGLAAGAAHALGNYIRLEALKHIDSVIYFPLNKVLGPLLVLIGGVYIFGDKLSVVQMIGVVCSISVPLLLISGAEHTRQSDLRRGLWFVVISTTLTSVSMLLTKQGLLYSSDIFFFLVMSQVAGVVSSTAIFIHKEKSFAHLTMRDVWLGVASGTLGFMAYATLLIALTTGLVSIVYVIQAHYILIPILLSIWWYKEHINIRKILAVVLSLTAIGLFFE